jgi:hypothetical protein
VAAVELAAEEAVPARWAGPGSDSNRDGMSRSPSFSHITRGYTGCRIEQRSRKRNHEFKRSRNNRCFG